MNNNSNSDLSEIRKLLEEEKKRKANNQKAIGYIAIGLVVYVVCHLLSQACELAAR